MILTTLQNIERYESQHPLFKTLFDYLKTHDLTQMPLGRIELDGEKLFINLAKSDNLPAEKQVLEMHRKYIDVQILLSGKETVGWKSLENLQHLSQEYNAEKDCAFSDDQPTSYIPITPGEIYILYPEDMHAPTIGEGQVLKAVGKVKIQDPKL